MARVVVRVGANLPSPMPAIRPEACAKSTAGLYQPLCASANVLSTSFRPWTAAFASGRSAVCSSAVSAAIIFSSIALNAA